MEPIRILCVFSCLNRGGAESMCMNLYRHIDRSKVQFDFVKHSHEKGAFEDEIQRLGGKIYEAPKYKGYNYWQYKSWWIKHLTKHPEHMIVHGHYTTISALYLGIAKKMGRITIGHSHCAKPGVKSLNEKMKDLALRGVKKVATYRFACGKEAGEWIYPNLKFKVLNNAIDVNAFSISQEKRLEIRKEFGIDNQLVIGHIGRFFIQKNHSFLIDIFKEIHDANSNSILFLVGDGELRSAVNSKVKSYGLEDSVIFTGVREDVSSLVQAMDVFVFPSLYEGLPVVGIEAQAAGLYCFFSEAVTREVDITGRCEFLPIGDPKLWAEKILSTDLIKVDTSDKIKSSGYDIYTTAKWLEKFYLRIAERR